MCQSDTILLKSIYFSFECCNFLILDVQGRGGDELSAELSSALQRCLLGGKSGAGALLDYIFSCHWNFVLSELLTFVIIVEFC